MRAQEDSLFLYFQDAERVLQTLDNPVTPQDFDLQQRVINQVNPNTSQ